MDAADKLEKAVADPEQAAIKPETPEENYKMLFEQSIDGIIVVADGCIVIAS